MDIGFVHTGMLDSEGVGSAHSATRLVYELADAGHQLTVYCPVSKEESPSYTQKTMSNIDIRIIDKKEGMPLVPDRLFSNIGDALLRRTREFEEFDVLHSYVSTISALAKIRNKISTPVITTLNGYGPVCPKKDLYFMDSSPCRENGMSRCGKCVTKSTVYPEDSEIFQGASVYEKYGGVKRPLATGYLMTKRFRSLRTILSIQERTNHLDLYHVQADHLKGIFEEFGFPRDRFYTVSNMLDERFLIPHQSDFTEPYRILYVGSLYKKKGVQKLPAVIDYLNEEMGTQCELTIVGDGPLQPYLEREIQQRGISGEVRGHIPYKELPEVYASHDIFLYPGIWEEPFARVFLEALATGTPIVGSQVGDLDEIIGNAGIVTDGTTEALGDAVYELTASKELTNKSKQAKQRAAQYKPDSVVPQLEQMYEKVLLSRS